MPISAPRIAIPFVVAASLLTTSRSQAQDPVSVPRADGRATLLLIYHAAAHSGSCAPLAVISRGAGGSEKGYRYLAQAVAQAGFAIIVMGHHESGLDALRSTRAPLEFAPEFKPWLPAKTPNKRACLMGVRPCSGPRRSAARLFASLLPTRWVPKP